MADETPPLDEAGIRERLARYEHTMDTATFYPGYVVTGNYVVDVPALLAEVDRLRAREAAAMEIVVELARQDDTRGINCTCRETMPVGHHEDCYVFRAHMMAHQLPDGSYE